MNQQPNNKNTAGKLILTTLLAIVSGCAIKPYTAPTEGPTSQITFTTPIIRDSVLADEDLDLIFYKQLNKCEFKAIGKIELEPDKLSNSTSIPANEPSFLRVYYYKNALGSSNTKGSFQFSFTPEKDTKYTIEYKEIPGKFKVNVTQNLKNGENLPIEISRWGVCTKKPNQETLNNPNRGLF